MNWRTLIYQIPREPQKNRMSVWRKLKSIGSLNVLQSIWILPDTNECQEEFMKLTSQVNNIGGHAFTCIMVIDDEQENSTLISNFNKERELDYRELLGKCRDFVDEINRETENENFIFAEFEENEQELEKLYNWLKKIEKKDYFHCEFKNTIIKNLEKCQNMLNEFSNQVYERNDI
ncbi:MULTISPECIES: Chromate resistance protein ChrB [unclassified Clostridium]|uniref:Chromate resistance protein ChrB n=1 Tax=unclassified Clostridium TaxID=2614128 RepID=UPI000297AFB0|nr:MULTISPECIES: Chromate resistance protein ChrB [unclassified Clostridium]EKQ54346.1 MAG: hypothetical protein A370_03165 [Clostridium sp. Maddingley MBC34-26]